MTSPIAALLIKRGLPLTVKSYLNFAYPDEIPKPIPAEILEEACGAISLARSHARRKRLIRNGAAKKRKHYP